MIRRWLMIPVFFLACRADAVVEPPAAVGVVQNRCAEVPMEPEKGPGVDASEAYGKWLNRLLRTDFAGFCRYARENARLPPATQQRIVFMGDSITEGWLNADPAFFGGDRIDRGISGQTTRQMLLRFRADVIDLKPAVVHILAGTNDIAGNNGPTTLAEIEGNLGSMAELADANGIRVVLGTILPARAYGWRPEVDPVPSIAAVNDWIRDYARKRKFGLVDYHAAMNDGANGLSKADANDGVHPTPLGYTKMKRLAEPVLAQALGK